VTLRSSAQHPAKKDLCDGTKRMTKATVLVRLKIQDKNERVRTVNPLLTTAENNPQFQKGFRDALISITMSSSEKPLSRRFKSPNLIL
jgi:hypothetical protein